MKPGIYRGIDNDAYHSGPGDSKSGLDLVHKAPVNLHAARTGAIERKTTPAQAIGSAVHALVLEPDVFTSTYALPFVPPAGALKTADDIKAALSDADVPFKSSAKKDVLVALVREHLPDAVLYADALADYEDDNAGRTILDPDTWAQIHSVRDAVMAHPAARKLLTAPGEAELSCYWNEPVRDPSTHEPVMDADGNPAELLLRCRPDFWRYDGIMVDLKTTSPGGAAPEEFARSLEKWRYHVQHPMYLQGTAEALRAADADSVDGGMAADFARFHLPRAFVFVVVENDACVVDGVAKGVAVYQLQADSVELGAQEMCEDIATLHACHQSSRWPGYPETIQAIDLPAYAFTKAAQKRPA